MDLGHDREHSLAALVDLVNSAEEPDTLDSVPALQSFVDDHQVSEVGRVSARDLTAVRALRARFRAIWSAADQTEVVDLVNRLVAESGATPRLTDHDGWPLHVHYFAPGSALADHLAADGAMALAFVLAAGERDRLRTCEAPDCGRVLVDLSRNRSRRYCDSRTCGNRLHVAAYRARRRTG